MSNNGCVIVTGSAGGNGFAIAKQLHSDGFRVLGFDLLKTNSDQFEIEFMADVTDETAINQIFSYATNQFTHVGLVNNAGITLPSKNGYKREHFEKTMDVNAKAPFLFMEKYYELVRAHKIKTGGIVNVCSLAAHRGFADNPAYIASKHALLGLTRAYALTLGEYGIRVNSVSPGYIQTNMTSKTFENSSRNLVITKNNLLKRWGLPHEVAEGVSFLLSDKSKYISGTDLPIDGGWLSQGMVD